MSTYLYRPVADEVAEHYDESYGETIVIEPGDNLGGRSSGYLSRSSAVAHGLKSGIAFRLERSNPITFGGQPAPAGQAELVRMGQTLADLVHSGDTDTAKALARAIRAH